MSDTEIIGFSGTFTDDELNRISIAVDRAEAQMLNPQSTSPHMPPWFVVKDDIPGHSRVFVAHRVGLEKAFVAHTLDDLEEQLRTGPSD
jgi:hypothetical protein